MSTNELLQLNDPTSFVAQSHFRKILGFCLFEVAYYFAYMFGMTFHHASASPFWFPDSVLLCALLWSPPQIWWLFILGALPIRLFSKVAQNIPLWFLLATSAIDFVKGVMTATALRHFNKNPIRFETIKEFGLFFFFAVLLIPVASAFGGAAVRNMIGSDYWTAWGEWFLGNATAQLVITPAILYLVFNTRWKILVPSTPRIIEAVILIAGLIMSGYIAFHSEFGPPNLVEPLFFAPVPFLFWAAIRFGMFGASGAITIIAILSVQAALNGRGPFAGQSPSATAFALQNFLLLRAAPLYLVAILVEQKNNAERSLRESEERFRDMANAAPVLMWMSGQDKLCTFFNQVWLNFTGRRMDQELGNGWTDNVHPDDLQHCLQSYHSSFEKRAQFEMEFRMRRNDGEYRWLMDIGLPRYDQRGNFIGYIGSAVDITERKRVEEASRNLEHAQRLTILGEFSAMIAHEVTQPLTAIMNNTEAALRMLNSANPKLDVIREILEDIRSDDRRAHETIREIRALLRKRDIHLEPLDLNQMASDVLRLVNADALRRHVEIRQQFSQDLPLAFGDSAYLQHVLLNLISNGLDAMLESPESKRQLTVQTKQVENNNIEVCVTDCGCGIAPNKLPQVFESFFTTKDQGMGLGLSIARSIVEAHHGRIWAENNSTGGTTFHFTVKAFNHPK